MNNRVLILIKLLSWKLRKDREWDRKRIRKGKQTDRKRVEKHDHPYAKQFLSVCFPFSIRLISDSYPFSIRFLSFCYPFPIPMRSHPFSILLLSYLDFQLWALSALLIECSGSLMFIMLTGPCSCWFTTWIGTANKRRTYVLYMNRRSLLILCARL